MELIQKAIDLAAAAHHGQLRKGTELPYISHPYAVGMMLMQAGCSEAVVVAGILHDTLEDTEVTAEQLRAEFGAEITDIVIGCSEPDKSLSWEERKRHTLEYLRTAPLDIRMVACADKIHNARSTVLEYRQLGEDVWSRFKRGREQQHWYYQGLVESLGSAGEFALLDVLRQEVRELFG